MTTLSGENQIGSSECQPNWTGEGEIVTGSVNIWGDPVFVDPAIGDYHIRLGSAALNAGAPAGVSEDMDGEPRDDGRPDIGADESVTLPAHVIAGSLPSGTAYVPGGTIVWPGLTIAPDGTWSYTFVVTLEAGYAGPLTTLVELASQEGIRGTYSLNSRAGHVIFLPFVSRGG
ncbi:MAG: hypothetical protein JW850_13530 [Thermoflexales bacterium]|nr:hypothetical protein [Thermoflexales bacterium]